MGWRARIKQRIEGLEPAVPWSLLNKAELHEFCEANSFPTARLLRVFERPSDIDLSGLPVNFVIKPNLESSMRGVMVLSRTDDGYFDSLRKRTLTLSQIVDEQARYFNEIQDPAKNVIIEELVVDIQGHNVPIDYKAYVFHGRVALVLEIDRNVSPSAVAWFDGSYMPLRDDKIILCEKYVQHKNGCRPSSWPELLDLARRVSLAIPTPFVSVDMYASISGPVVGELTLTPGGLYFGEHFNLSDGLDHLMGEMWDEAERNLISRS